MTEKQIYNRNKKLLKQYLKEKNEKYVLRISKIFFREYSEFEKRIGNYKICLYLTYNEFKLKIFDLQNNYVFISKNTKIHYKETFEIYSVFNYIYDFISKFENIFIQGI